MTMKGFEKFYRLWLDEERNLLDPLRNLGNVQKSNAEITPLVHACYLHYAKYVDAKIRVAREDVNYVAAGMWRTPLESGFLWIGGWRPTSAIVLAFSLIGMQIESELRNLLEGIDVPSMAALSSKQLAKLNSLQQETRDNEDDISNRLAILQMLVVDEQMARATTAEPPPSEMNDLSMIRGALEARLVGLRDLFIEAEQLRLHTLHGMMLVLTPLQAAQYTVAAFEMAKAVRKLGSQELHTYSSRGVENIIWELASERQICELEDAMNSGRNLCAIDTEGRTPLYVAAGEGQMEVVEILIKQGADVNKLGCEKTSECIGSSQELGTGLCIAAAAEDVRHGSTPVDEARQSGSDATLTLLEDELARREDVEDNSHGCGHESSEESILFEGIENPAKSSPHNKVDVG